MPNWNDLGFYDEGFDLAAPAFYASAIRTSEPPTVLPPAAFRSLPFSILEDEAIWSQQWVCVGSVDDIPHAGDLAPFTIGNHGVHVQRTADGLEARFNKAQHGGCRAIPLQCQTGAKTKCSFTSCGYSRDRRAIPANELGSHAPAMHQYLGLRPERLLKPALRVAGRAMFVNLNPHAAWPDDGLSDVPLLVEAAALGGRTHEVWREHQANWKLLASAFATGDTIIAQGASWLASADDASGLRMTWLFPNLILMGDRAQTAVIVLQPTALGQTLCRITVRGATGAVPEPWLARIAARAARAEALHADAVRFNTQHRPETVGQPLPTQTCLAGRWMQQKLAASIARVPVRQSLHARVANF